MEEEIEKCSLKARAAQTNDEAERIKQMRTDLEVKRGDYADQRTEKLEELRLNQGVWADGRGVYFPRGYYPWGHPDQRQAADLTDPAASWRLRDISVGDELYESDS
ncbi:MAG: hypothetical protein Q9218_007935 [Villophora microphyllina]